MRNFGIPNPSTPETYSTHVRSPAPYRADGGQRDSYPAPMGSIYVDDAPADVDDVASSALKFLGSLAILAICAVLLLSYFGAKLLIS
jgi:hypothetical protein